MYLEELLKEIQSSIKLIQLKLENSLSNAAKLSSNSHDYYTIKQLCKSGLWPYSEHATRKMISRKKLIEGIHYSKIDGRIILYYPALKEYLEKSFYHSSSMRCA